MIEPVTSRPTSDLWEAYAANEAQYNKITSNQSSVDTEAAEEQVVSLWYLSSIESLKASSNSIQATQNPKIVVQADKQEQSRIQQFKAWLWSWFGNGSSADSVVETIQPEPATIDDSIQTQLPRAPKLQTPEAISRERLSKAIADLNKDLLHRLKDTAEFEAEMRKSNSKAMDRLILFHIVSKSLDQKKLKEEAGLQAHEHILELQKLNKELHLKNYRLIDDINATAKTNAILHWVNIGTTVGIVGTLAVGFATGGLNMVFAITLPALNILKGGASAAEGVLKYRNDLRTGEMVMLNNQVKANRGQIDDKVNNTLPNADEEISNLLITIRRHLENYSKEARLSPQGS